MGRFLSADTQVDSNAGLAGYNLFSYCANSPVTFADSSGFALETILDVGSVISSFISLISNPTWVNVGYLAWDIEAAVLPFIPASYISKAGKLVIKVAGKIYDFTDGSQLLTGAYKQLKKMVKGIKGVEIHHLIEKRFRRLFSCNPREFLSIALTPEMHQIITNRWRNLHKVDEIFENFSYGSNYLLITYDLMVQAVGEVYKDLPDAMQATLEWLEKNWKGVR